VDTKVKIWNITWPGETIGSLRRISQRSSSKIFNEIEIKK